MSNVTKKEVEITPIVVIRPDNTVIPIRESDQIITSMEARNLTETSCDDSVVRELLHWIMVQVKGSAEAGYSSTVLNIKKYHFENNKFYKLLNVLDNLGFKHKVYEMKFWDHTEVYNKMEVSWE